MTIDSLEAPLVAAEEPIVAAPVISSERISAIDLLRGVAVLGILLMNIESFGLPNRGNVDLIEAKSWFNSNFLAWIVVGILFEGKMRAIFSMLFGAGVILLTSRAESRGNAAGIADVYFRRNIWLLVLGVFHAYFIWEGDILYQYAMAGLFLYVFRHVRPGVLLPLGLVLLSLMIPLCVIMSYVMAESRDKALKITADEKAGKKLTEEQIKERDDWKKAEKMAHPDAKAIEKQIKEHKSGYWEVFGARAKSAFKSQTVMTYKFLVWETLGTMLVGMALFKLGVFSGECSKRTYTIMAAAGLGVGYSIFAYMLYVEYQSKFDMITFFRAMALYEPGRIAGAIGLVGLIMLIYKEGYLQWLTSRLAAVGRMALSNYLGTSLACTLVFNGYGLGFYGSMSRSQVYLVVLGVWLVMLLWSPVWLKFFRFGPVEWLWRSLTYVKFQPLRAFPSKPKPLAVDMEL